MEKRNIGKSGLSAPFLGLGTWAIGGGSWWGDNDDALSVKAIETAVEQGITWIDTAPIYGLYHSEEVVGEALRHIDRDKVILSTKCGLEWRHESPVLHKVVDGVQTYRDLSAKSIIEDVEDSLRRLGTDYIDLLYFHRADFDAPLGEAVRAIGDLIRAGKLGGFHFNDSKYGDDDLDSGTMASPRPRTWMASISCGVLRLPPSVCTITSNCSASRL